MLELRACLLLKQSRTHGTGIERGGLWGVVRGGCADVPATTSLCCKLERGRQEKGSCKDAVLHHHHHLNHPPHPLCGRNNGGCKEKTFCGRSPVNCERPAAAAGWCHVFQSDSWICGKYSDCFCDCLCVCVCFFKTGTIQDKYATDWLLQVQALLCKFKVYCASARSLPFIALPGETDLYSPYAL